MKCKKNYTKKRRPVEQGWNNRILFPILGTLFIIASLALWVFSYVLPWFGLYLQLIAKFAFVLGILFWAPTIYRWLLNGKYSGSKSRNELDLSSLGQEEFRDQLVSMGIFIDDPNNTLNMRIPNIKFTTRGFKIAAIGNLRKKLLCDETIDDFNSYLSLHNAHCRIRSSYYHNGYVYYEIGNSIDYDRLNFR